MRLHLTRSRIGKIALAVLFAIALLMWAKILTAQEPDKYSFGIGVTSLDAGVFGGTITKAASSFAGGRVSFSYGDGTQIGIAAFLSSVKTKDLKVEGSECSVCLMDMPNWTSYGVEVGAAQSFNTGTAFLPYLGVTAGYAWLNPGEITRTTTGPVVGVTAGNFYHISKHVKFQTAVSVKSFQYSQIDTPYGIIDNAVIWSLMAGIAIK